MIQGKNLSATVELLNDGSVFGKGKGVLNVEGGSITGRLEVNAVHWGTCSLRYRVGDEEEETLIVFTDCSVAVDGEQKFFKAIVSNDPALRKMRKGQA